MHKASHSSLEQRTGSLGVLCVMMLVILLVQFWLLTVSLEASLAGQRFIALPSFIASGICFAINVWLVRWVFGLDPASASGSEESPHGRS